MGREEHRNLLKLKRLVDGEKLDDSWAIWKRTEKVGAREVLVVVE